MNRRTVALLAALVSCHAFGAQAKMEPVAPADAWLVINDRALGVTSRGRWRVADNPNQYIEILSATAPTGLPRIELWFGQLYGDFYWSAKVHDLIDRVKKTFVIFNDKSVDRTRTIAFRNHLGRGEAAAFRAMGKSCIAFQQFFGDATLGRGSKDLFGYYCAGVGDDIGDATIEVITRQYGVSGPEAPPQPDDKALSVLAALRGPPVAAGAAARPHPQVRTAPFALSWEGEADRLSGTMTYTQDGGHGEINVPVPQWSAICSGRWQYQSGIYGTADLPAGTWSIGCSNGLTAEGRYVSDAEGRGTGTGRDTRGRAVEVSFGR